MSQTVSFELSLVLIDLHYPEGLPYFEGLNKLLQIHYKYVKTSAKIEKDFKRTIETLTEQLRKERVKNIELNS